MQPAHAGASDRYELLGHVLSGTIALPTLVSMLSNPPPLPETRLLRPAPVADVGAPAAPLRDREARRTFLRARRPT